MHFVFSRLQKPEGRKKNFKNIQNTVIDVKFDEESKSELRIGLPSKDKHRNQNKNQPNNEGKFRKIEERHLPLFPNPQLSFWKVFHS